MESKKINQLATELTPALSDLTIIGDPTTGISKKITLSQMASLFTGTVEEYANVAAFPLVGVADTIYIALDTNVLYRWDTSLTSYVELSPNIINSLVFSDANGFDGNISLVGSVATLTITTALTTGSVPFIGASGALSQDNANLFFDDTNNRLGINTNAPTTALDVFGSGIIGRINGTSTNNAYLGFASAGTNKWSVGNVQSDHRFRIFSEANSAELATILQTGEFGIGIANPTTKFHIDGAASALIANLDANVSVAKSLSFRSDNSNRINLEVSGTESGSDAGANFFLRAYSDAGALLSTPLTITRATGAAAFSNSVTFAASVINFVGSSKLISGNGSTINYLYSGTTSLSIQNQADTATIASISNTGAATFNSGLTINQNQNATSTSTFSNNDTTNTSSRQYVDIVSGNRTLSLRCINGDNTYVASNGGSIQIQPNNATAMTLTSSGNVGIGTSSPAYTLDVLSTNQYTARFNSSAAQGGFAAWANSGTAYGYIGNAYHIVGGGAVADMGISATANMVFATSGTLIERMRIESSGDIKIGIGAGVTDTKFLMISKGTTSSTFALVVKKSNLADLFTIRDDGAVTVAGSLSKGSGSFRIDHPLESMTETHQLVHSFVEAPQADLYYRGKIKLVNGKGEANIDEVSTMTEGTFEALCREVQCFTTNESGWDLIKGKVIGNIIYLESQNAKSTDEISWLVIGERKDKHIMDTDWTDENGKVIVEPLKPIKEEVPIIEEENAIIEEEEVIIEEKEVILEPKTI